MEGRSASHMAGVAPSSLGYLTLDIKDFGPISRGSITVKPLTILVGPNGCGKTHVAVLVHSVTNAGNRNPRGSEISRQDADKILVANESVMLTREYLAGEKTTFSSNMYSNMQRMVMQSLKDELSDNFSSDVTGMVRFGKSNFQLGVSAHGYGGNIIGTAKKITPLINQQKLTVCLIKDGKLPKNKPMVVRSKDGTIQVLIDISGLPNVESVITNQIIDGLMAFVREAVNPKRCVYFPAERGGLMLINKLLMQDYYRRMIKPDTTSLLPRMTGALAGFLGTVGSIAPNRKSDFNGMTASFEEDVMHGMIAVQSDGAGSHDIIFRQDGNNIPFHVAASSIKDLAGFLLYVKHAARQGDTLILEEPEINLHPRNQRHLALLVAKLVNSGLCILVTTHSPYFLEQLSHCVMGGMAGNGKTLKQGERLKPDRVAIYGYHSKDGGYEISPIKLDEEGIPQSEFVKVDEELYDELVSLRQESK